jgi:hypothetical protein
VCHRAGEGGLGVVRDPGVAAFGVFVVEDRMACGFQRTSHLARMAGMHPVVSGGGSDQHRRILPLGGDVVVRRVLLDRGSRMMAARGKARRNANGQGGVYRRADGRWEAKVFVDTPDGRRKRISVYGDSERAALDELGKVRDQQRRGIPIATTTLTVAGYMTYWLEHVAEPSIRRTTYDVRRTLRTRVMSAFTSCRVSASGS